jgi:hypothetical protein
MPELCMGYDLHCEILETAGTGTLRPSAFCGTAVSLCLSNADQLSEEYLDQLAIRYGIRSWSGAINFLIESHRQSQTSPNLGPANAAAKQAE